jgi:hypothetical protein
MTEEAPKDDEPFGTCRDYYIRITLNDPSFSNDQVMDQLQPFISKNFPVVSELYSPDINVIVNEPSHAKRQLHEKGQHLEGYEHLEPEYIRVVQDLSGIFSKEIYPSLNTSPGTMSRKIIDLCAEYVVTRNYPSYVVVINEGFLVTQGLNQGTILSSSDGVQWSISCTPGSPFCLFGRDIGQLLKSGTILLLNDYLEKYSRKSGN